MKRAALGVRMHSGWGILVAVSGDVKTTEVIYRKRILTIDASVLGATTQPYHAAEKLAFEQAEKYLETCATASKRLALAALTEVIEEFNRRHYEIVGCGVLSASGRILPSLSKILASHLLIHTAEGEFFRDVVRKACEDLRIPVTTIPERELDERSKIIFEDGRNTVKRRISTLGSSIGPPWTKDHKTAALAAAIVLACSEGLE